LRIEAVELNYLNNFGQSPNQNLCISCMGDDDLGFFVLTKIIHDVYFFFKIR